MAAGDRVQKGQEWKVGFGALSYTGYLPEDFTFKNKDADDEVIKDERNATITHILTDPRVVMSGSFLIKSTGSITPPNKGDWISLQGPADVAAKYYRVDDASVAFSRSVSKLSLSLLLEDAHSNGATIDDATDDYNTSTHANVAATLTFNDATVVTGIRNLTDGVALALTTDYTVVGTTLTLVGAAHLQTYITAAADSAVFEVSFDKGAPVYWTITGT